MTTVSPTDLILYRDRAARADFRSPDANANKNTVLNVKVFRSHFLLSTVRRKYRTTENSKSESSYRRPAETVWSSSSLIQDWTLSQIFPRRQEYNSGNCTTVTRQRRIRQGPVTCKFPTKKISIKNTYALKTVKILSNFKRLKFKISNEKSE